MCTLSRSSCQKVRAVAVVGTLRELTHSNGFAEYLSCDVRARNLGGREWR